MSPAQTLLAEVLGPDATGDDPMTDRILDATYEQLLAFGLRRLSVEDAARRAGIARITVYRRFASKDDLVAAVVLREGRRLFAEVDGLVSGLPRADDQVVEGFVAILIRVRRHPLVQRILATEPEVALPLATLDGGPVIALARDYLAAHLRRAQRAGQLARFDPGPVAELLVRVTQSFLLTPDSCIPLHDEADARRFARRYLLPILQPLSPR